MSRRRRGQASLEMIPAIIGVLVLLVGGFQIMLWMTRRLVVRQHYFERTRSAAGRKTVAQARRGPVWNDPTRVRDPKDPHDPNALHIFK